MSDKALILDDNICSTANVWHIVTFMKSEQAGPIAATMEDRDALHENLIGNLHLNFYCLCYGWI